MSGEAEREGFLARWSRRKRAVQAGEAAAEAAPAAPAAETVPAPAAGTSAVAPGQAAPSIAAGEPEFDFSSLPKIEDLTADSDLTPFFAKGVPAALRQAALSRIWSLDPAIRDFVGPADYAWDFNAPDGVPGFGFDLPEEAKALAKRLLGVDREGQAQAERPVALAEPQPAAGAAAELPPAASAAPEADAPPAFLPPGVAAPALSSPAPDADAAPELAALPPPRRRHGSALPT